MAKGVVGAQLYTVRDSCKTLPDLQESAKRVADMGYTAVQLSALGDIDPKDVAKVMADNGLKIAATHAPWDAFLNKLDEVIAEHKVYDCQHLAIGGLPNDYRSVEGVKQFIDELAPVAEKLAAEGMDFSYHNHSQELARYGEKTWLAMVYEQSDPSVLKAELDTYWIQHGGGDPVAWVKKCAGREPLLHFKDMCIMPDREQRFAEIGEGNLNWPEIIKAGEEGGAEYYLVEQDQCYDRDPFESLKISYDNLKALGLS